VTRPPRGPGRRAEEACAGPARGPRDRAHPVVSVAGILHVRQRVGVDRRVREASARRDVAHVHAQRHRLEEPVGQVLVDEFAPTRRQDVGVERSTTVLPDQRHDRAFGVQVTAPQRHLVEHLVHRVGHDPQLVLRHLVEREPLHVAAPGLEAFPGGGVVVAGVEVAERRGGDPELQQPEPPQGPSRAADATTPEPAATREAGEEDRDGHRGRLGRAAEQPPEFPDPQHLVDQRRRPRRGRARAGRPCDLDPAGRRRCRRRTPACPAPSPRRDLEPAASR
jgi:hypothetical protein